MQAFVGIIAGGRISSFTTENKHDVISLTKLGIYDLFLVNKINSKRIYGHCLIKFPFINIIILRTHTFYHIEFVHRTITI